MQMHFLRKICFTNLILLSTSLCVNSDSGMSEGKTTPAEPKEALIAPPEEPKIPAEESSISSSEKPRMTPPEESKIETQYLATGEAVRAKYKSSDVDDEKTCNVEWSIVSKLPESPIFCWATCMGRCFYYYRTSQQRCNTISYNGVVGNLCDCCTDDIVKDEEPHKKGSVLLIYLSPE